MMGGAGPGHYAGPSYSGGGGSGYVRGAADPCATDRCQLTEARAMLAQAESLNRLLIKEKKQMEETAALWCDAGHSFSARDRGRKRITVTGQNPDTGADEQQTRQFCGQCAITPAMLEAPVLYPAKAGYDPARVAELERELGMLRSDGN